MNFEAISNYERQQQFQSSFQIYFETAPVSEM